MKHAKLLKQAARFGAALVLIAALIKFVLTFSFSAAFAIGIGGFALICLAGSDAREPADPASQTPSPAPRTDWLAGLMRMMKFEDRDGK